MPTVCQKHCTRIRELYQLLLQVPTTAHAQMIDHTDSCTESPCARRASCAVCRAASSASHATEQTAQAEDNSLLQQQEPATATAATAAVPEGYFPGTAAVQAAAQVLVVAVMLTALLWHITVHLVAAHKGTSGYIWSPLKRVVRQFVYAALMFEVAALYMGVWATLCTQPLL